MDGRLTIESSNTIYDLLYLITKNMEFRYGNPMHLTGQDWFSRLKSWFAQINTAKSSKANVAHHYDLSGELYDLFLDEDKQYSCAYFSKETDTLEQAQYNKKDLIAKKLMIEEGNKILDIGCGWGGMALFLAEHYGAKTKGITLSEEQLLVAQQRTKDKGLTDSVTFSLEDYRHMDEKFDRIVSVGMFEHVGRKQYETYFNKVRDLMTDDGIALIHTIGRADGPGTTDPWTVKYIFPGGYTPGLSEIAPIIEKAGLWITDLEILRLHYAKTLEEWRKRTFANKDKIVELYDDRFFRMWDYYLSSAECAFRNMGHVIFQIQLTKSQHSLPLTRDYMLGKV